MKESLHKGEGPFGRVPRFVGASALSVVIGMSALGAGPAPAFAANGLDGPKDIDTSLHYTPTGIEDSSLRYAGTTFNRVEPDGTISMTVSNWRETNPIGEWRTSKDNEFAGHYVLTFSDPEFFKQIDTITIRNVSLEKRDDGALWMTEIKDAVFDTILIGVVRNQDMKITLKDGQTLEGLGLADQPIGFSSVWIKSNGAAARESISSGYILQNNPDLSTNQKETGFLSGRMTQRVFFDLESRTIRSVHTFKSDENYLQTDYNWVVGVKERVPAELAAFIDRDNVTIQNTNEDGSKPGKSAGLKDLPAFKVQLSEDGLVDTFTNAKLGIVGNNTTKQLDEARDATNDIFYGTLGQSRNYTIFYQLKDDVDLTEFANAMNDYIEKNNRRVLFSHWLTADYLDERDGGADPQQLKDSYSNAYLETNDTDKDGLFDFVELEVGTDFKKVDTDGDGVPDGQEFTKDNTDAKNSKSHKPAVAVPASAWLDNGADSTITGTAPWVPIADPSDESKTLAVTDANAYPLKVTLHKLLDDGTYEAAAIAASDVGGGASVAFDNHLTGEFSISVTKAALDAAGIAKGDKLVLVSHSPQGETAQGGTITVGEAPTLADQHELEGQPVETPLGVQPNAEAAAKNAAALPTGTVFSWESPVDVSKPATVKGTLVATYPDGSTDKVEVDVAVKDSRADNVKYTATGGELTKPYGETATAAELAAKVTTDAPADRVASIEPIGTIPAVGEGLAVPMRVTYADGTFDDAIVLLTYGKAADAFEPLPNPVETEQGKQPDAEDAIKNKGELPGGTDYKWKEPVDVSKPGDTTGTVIVTYPDGSKDEVEVPIIVVKPDVPTPPTDAEAYFAAGGSLYKPYGQVATEVELAAQVSTNAPTDKVASITSTNTIPTEGANLPCKMVVTYADGTADNVVVMLTYGSAADSFEPVGQPVETEQGTQPNAADGIANKADLPADSVYVWEQPIDVSKPGTVPGTVVVVYPDGSTDRVPVEVTVTEKAPIVDPSTDADKYEPEVEPEVVKPGEKPNLEDNVTNIDKLPDGTQVEDITPDGTIDPSKPGDYEGTIKVTYPDGSEDIVKVPVEVVDDGSGDNGGDGKDDGNGDGADGGNGDGTGDNAGDGSGNGAGNGSSNDGGNGTDNGQGTGDGNGSNAGDGRGSNNGDGAANGNNAGKAPAKAAAVKPLAQTGDPAGVAAAGGIAAAALAAIGVALAKLRTRFTK